MSEVKGRLGFGCMRLPMKDGEVDHDLFCEMIDEFIAAGFNYFDTAHGYIGGKSETAMAKCLVDRYPRDKYILADKLSENFFKTEADIRPFFESQLKIMGVDYFDYYLMHAQNMGNYKQYTDCRAYEVAKELKAEGKIRHIAISFHDTAAALEKILSEHPEIEAVQIQFNYLDYSSPSVQSREVYEVCVKHRLPVIVMEPVRGGALANVPEGAKAIFDRLSGSPASYAIRFAAGFDSVLTVLSGMSSPEQMKDNISAMRNFSPLSDAENAAIAEAKRIIELKSLIGCTACRYCVDGCPSRIAIPDLFSCLNTKKQADDWNSAYYYKIHTEASGKASDCIKCGRCEAICPQHLEIRKLLEDTANMFERT